MYVYNVFLQVSKGYEKYTSHKTEVVNKHLIRCCDFEILNLNNFFQFTTTDI